LKGGRRAPRDQPEKKRGKDFKWSGGRRGGKNTGSVAAEKGQGQLVFLRPDQKGRVAGGKDPGGEG